MVRKAGRNGPDFLAFAAVTPLAQLPLWVLRCSCASLGAQWLIAPHLDAPTGLLERSKVGGDAWLVRCAVALARLGGPAQWRGGLGASAGVVAVAVVFWVLLVDISTPVLFGPAGAGAAGGGRRRAVVGRGRLPPRACLRSA